MTINSVPPPKMYEIPIYKTQNEIKVLLFSELAKLMQVEMHNMLICTLYIVCAILCRKYVQPHQ